MLRFLLDVPPEPTAMEKIRNNPWPLLVAALALVGLIVYFVYRYRKNKSKS